MWSEVHSDGHRGAARSSEQQCVCCDQPTTTKYIVAFYRRNFLENMMLGLVRPAKWECDSCHNSVDFIRCRAGRLVVACCSPIANHNKKTRQIYCLSYIIKIDDDVAVRSYITSIYTAIIAYGLIRHSDKTHKMQIVQTWTLTDDVPLAGSLVSFSVFAVRKMRKMMGIFSSPVNYSIHRIQYMTLSQQLNGKPCARCNSMKWTYIVVPWWC